MSATPTPRTDAINSSDGFATLEARFDAMHDLAEELEQQVATAAADKRRLDWLQSNSCDLRCFDMPTGQGDADIGWRVIEHHMAEPNERIIGEVFRDDLRAAIDAAMSSETKPES